MYVCVCYAVTDREIAERVRAGVHTLDGLSFELGVATCCGQCAGCARGVVDATLAAMRETATPAPVPGAETHRPRDLLASA